MSAYRPLIGISVGDPAGIGPEITAKALSLREIHDICRPLAVAETAMMQDAVKFSGLIERVFAEDKRGKLSRPIFKPSKFVLCLHPIVENASSKDMITNQILSIFFISFIICPFLFLPD